MTPLPAIDVADQVAALGLALFTRLRDAAAAGGGLAWPGRRCPRGPYARVARAAGLIVAADDRAGRSLAVFGDFWRQAARLASPPPYPDPPTGAADRTSRLRRPRRRRRRRYVDDIAAVGTGVRDGSWADAIARARAATTLIPGLSRARGRPGAGVPGRVVCLPPGRYATALTYGRDLLHTHLATTPDGQRRALSDWAPVISSAPVNRALLAGLAEHARAIAGQLAGLPLAGTPDPETVAAWQRLHGAAGQLRELDAAVQAAQWQRPVPAEHRQLLEAIPVNVTPAAGARMPPLEATVCLDIRSGSRGPLFLGEHQGCERSGGLSTTRDAGTAASATEAEQPHDRDAAEQSRCGHISNCIGCTRSRRAKAERPSQDKPVP